MIHDTIKDEIAMVEKILSDLERCKDTQGVFNHDALCYIASLRDIARQYLYSLYRLKKGFDLSCGVNIETDYNDPGSVVQELCFYDNLDGSRCEAGRGK